MLKKTQYFKFKDFSGLDFIAIKEQIAMSTNVHDLSLNNTRHNILWFKTKC